MFAKFDGKIMLFTNNLTVSDSFCKFLTVYAVFWSMFTDCLQCLQNVCTQKKRCMKFSNTASTISIKKDFLFF